VHPQEIVPFLQEQEQNRYYGTIELRYENGLITVIKRLQTLKPQDILTEDSRGYSRH
jgi:hypothetical protein